MRRVISKRRARALGGRLLRRLGAVPGGTPDGLGEDDRLLGTRLAQTVIVYFPETVTNLYQLRQWYEALAALDVEHPVIVVTQDSRVARTVRAETGLAVACIARSATLDDLLSRSDVRLMLYLSHHPANFQALRTLDVAHVYLTHGDSDKLVSVSNQLKAYDLTFVAGQAAVDRAANRLIWFDAPTRLIPIGRPQLDGFPEGPPPQARLTVLYAPTWEGAQPSTAYSSLRRSGVSIVRSLIEDGELGVIYRPHPRTGARRAEYLDADRAVRDLVNAAARDTPGGGHRVDTSPSPLAAMAESHVLISDVSAMALDWLVTGRALALTEPASPAAVVTAGPLWDVVPRITAADAWRAAEVVRDALQDDAARPARDELARYYLGDTSPGAATTRFVAECDALLARRDDAVAELPPR